ncbi:Phage shock protein G [Kluyvera cryocrescens]|uniref:Phage shock protein G n=1 Tax=Kluyvera cryocrescens TaxID=580 RepID=A0A485B7V9_KLUCR|nr:Phage shock protein G [Kluyvera cryocrescens]
MLELLFVIGFFVMLLVTGISLLGIIAALVVATVLMFVGGLFALMIKLLPWLLFGRGGGCGSFGRLIHRKIRACAATIGGIEGFVTTSKVLHKTPLGFA